MFSDKYGLTKAVLEGRKTMTRLVVPEKLLEAYYDYDDYVNAVAPRGIPCSREYEEEFFLRRSRFKVGEVVAVAQAYKDTCWTSPVLRLKDKPGWSNKMFVYAGLMPHQIRITNVRVERLQDISDEDCVKEGVWEAQLVNYTSIDGIYHSPCEAFAALIDKVSGKGIWESNPWVFVYEFELVI